MNAAILARQLWNDYHGPRPGRRLAGSPAREHAGARVKRPAPGTC
ncbi:MAG: hypothetical protein FAZ92_01981 [Accumulibacter sp.]|nr:hypothetical protein [Accumulibacter sp.]TLD45746.1 MAG: hypothetical protein FAZ92_01981 [Accumulibacter sp.]